ncbi:hypothetical protein FB446DRAFT_793565 [Lentinula raphanica]|nr:hypothetical protein FB446DRAFT_793565 [Lentinula raphanica]
MDEHDEDMGEHHEGMGEHDEGMGEHDEGMGEHDEDMEFDEETGSEDTSNTDDEEEADAGLDDAEDKRGWEDEDEEDLVPDEIDKTREEHDVVNPQSVAGDEIDEAEWTVQGPIQIIHAEDEEDLEAASEEDFGHDLNLVENGEIMRGVFNKP